jgi:ABC-type nitrate/sulfonate/bicarbonate transport system permease component
MSTAIACALLVQRTPLVAMLPLVARIFGYDEASVIAGAFPLAAAWPRRDNASELAF